MATAPEAREVALATITVGFDRRLTKPAVVKALADSILEVGVLQPIGVRKHGDDHRLIFGRHRLEACRVLGRDTIPAIVYDIDDLHAELAEIDENLQRHSLTVLEESKALARRKAIYTTLHPHTVQHRAGGHGKHGSASDKLSFAADAATRTGKSRRTIEREVEIGEAITDAAAEQLRDHPIANNRSQLKRLADLPAEEQVKAAAAIAEGQAETVEQATAAKRVTEDPRIREEQKRIAKSQKKKPDRVLVSGMLERTWIEWRGFEQSVRFRPSLVPSDPNEQAQWRARIKSLRVVVNNYLNRLESLLIPENCPRGGDHEPDEDGDCRKCLEPNVGPPRAKSEE